MVLVAGSTVLAAHLIKAAVSCNEVGNLSVNKCNEIKQGTARAYCAQLKRLLQPPLWGANLDQPPEHGGLQVVREICFHVLPISSQVR